MQQSILNATSFKPPEPEKPKTGKGSGKPRGPYKPRKVKIYPVSFYQKLDEIRFQLALMLDCTLLFKQTESFIKETRFYRIHFEKYTAAKYEYQGEVCEGENFKIIQAELKGCEALRIKESLFIHRRLFNLIKSGYTPDEAALLMQKTIKNFSTGKIIFNDLDTDAKEFSISGKKNTNNTMEQNKS